MHSRLHVAHPPTLVSFLSSQTAFNPGSARHLHCLVSAGRSWRLEGRRHYHTQLASSAAIASMENSGFTLVRLTGLYFTSNVRFGSNNLPRPSHSLFAVLFQRWRPTIKSLTSGLQTVFSLAAGTQRQCESRIAYFVEALSR